MLATEFLKQTRLAKKLSIRDVEELAGGHISHPFINQQENGRIKSPTVKSIYFHSKGLGLDPLHICKMLIDEIETDVEKQGD